MDLEKLNIEIARYNTYFDCSVAVDSIYEYKSKKQVINRLATGVQGCGGTSLDPAN